MNPILSVMLALAVASPDEPVVDGRTLFAFFQKYHAAIRDVTFLYEGRMNQLARTAGIDPDPLNPVHFQGLYAYRSDGATVMDLFSRKRGDRPQSRMIATLLNGRLEQLDASPDTVVPGTRLRDRHVFAMHGGPGSLSAPDSPEFFFLLYYYPTLTDPTDHELRIKGWETVEDRRCLRVRMLQFPRSRLPGAAGPFQYLELWVDMERDASPIRIDHYAGDSLEGRVAISRFDRRTLPNGRSFFLPVAGRALSFGGQDDRGTFAVRKEPVFEFTYTILPESVRFDQRLPDAFFSAKRQALVPSDDELRKLQREMDKQPPPLPKRRAADPTSRQKRLDEALEEADKQAKQLEASSAATAGPGLTGAMSAGLAALGVLSLAGAFYWHRTGR